MKSEKRDRSQLTRILVRKYRIIRQSCDEVILERMHREESYCESFEWFEQMMQGRDPDRIFEELHKTSERTEAIICRIERAMEIYGQMARKEDLQSWREYDALYSVYFSGFSNSKVRIREISRKYGVKKSTIYDDIKTAQTRLESVLFGDQSSPSNIFLEHE